MDTLYKPEPLAPASECNGDQIRIIAFMNPITLGKTTIAHMRFARSVLSGAPVHLPSLRHLIQIYAANSAKPTRGSSVLGTPDPQVTQQLQERRIQQQVQLAVRDTDYYADLFAQLGLRAQDFTPDQFTKLPLTTKEALRDHPQDFVRHGFRPTLATMTTGTTGRGITMFFTNRESQIFSSMTAMGLLQQDPISSADIVQMSTSARALLGNQTTMDACRQVGALAYQTGVVDPERALVLLSQKHELPGRKTRASMLYTYPSYLGKLIETGLAMGYGPQDFSLEHINVGGEVSSMGLRQRSEALFGPVTFSEGYGISEAWPFGGSYCEEGHLHFHPLRGLVEVIDSETGQPAQPGEVGSLVLTPFYPFRESTIVLRYDTGDMVRTLGEPPTCSLKNHPATSALMGKSRFCIRTETGWFGPRDILEILEPNLAIPLPVRFAFFEETGGLKLQVTVNEVTDTLHQEISAQLRSAGIPVGTLQLITKPSQLERPFPWRGDLHENSFSTTDLRNICPGYAEFSLH